MPELPSVCILVRTWFGDDDAWNALIEEIETPSEEDFLACVKPVNDPAFEGLTAEELKARQPGGSIVSFLADKTTLTNSDHPILAVWVLPLDEDDDRDTEPFRVVPGALWSVENNINISNMDWWEFTGAVDEHGIFRGF